MHTVVVEATQRIHAVGAAGVPGRNGERQRGLHLAQVRKGVELVAGAHGTGGDQYILVGGVCAVEEHELFGQDARDSVGHVGGAHGTQVDGVCGAGGACGGARGCVRSMRGGGALLRGGGSCRGQGHAGCLSGGTHGGCDAFVLRSGGADFAVIGQVEQQVAAVVDDQVQRLNGVGDAAFFVVGQGGAGGGGVRRRDHEPAQGGSAAVVSVHQFYGVTNLSQGTRVHMRDGAHLTQGTVADAQGSVAGRGGVHVRGRVVVTAGGKQRHERQGGERRTAGDGQSVH